MLYICYTCVIIRVCFFIDKLMQKGGTMRMNHIPETQRITITLSSQMLHILDHLEECYGWTKSQAISFALAHYSLKHNRIQPSTDNIDNLIKEDSRK